MIHYNPSKNVNSVIVVPSTPQLQKESILQPVKWIFLCQLIINHKF